MNKFALYPRLALMGITKNKQLCFPYILTCIGMVMMYYIMKSLSVCDLLKNISRGGSLMMILALGRIVIAVFALIFLFYTNSFLIRRRNRELGLYNILGMDKLNIAWVISLESIMTAAVGLSGGLFFGILFSKFAELGLLRVIHADVDYTFRVSPLAISDTIVTFTVIFALILISSLRHVAKTDPLTLLHSENLGEKAPRANWLLALVGALLIGGAYVIAINLKDPTSALLLFFVAVIMVIVGTYALMTAGSVTLCRLLQRNKRYYYKKNHFVSVSSMTFRMKRNGAGLASICILCTMVLVMISSSLSLYIGMDESIRTRYTREILVNVIERSVDDIIDDNIPSMRGQIDERVRSVGSSVKNVIDYCYLSIAGVFENGHLSSAPDDETLNHAKSGTADYAQFYVMPYEDYKALSGDERELKSGEVFIRCDTRDDLPARISVDGSDWYEVAGATMDFPDSGNATVMAMDTYFVITNDLESIAGKIGVGGDYTGFHYVPTYNWLYAFDINDGNDARVVSEIMTDGVNGRYDRFYVESRAEKQSDFFETFGGLFFIGVILSLVFMTATVLIIYYKQVSEGYEDRSRFDIMQKIGMTQQDIRKSINSQVLTVFFAPLCLAGLHMIFAFPFIWRMLQLFALTNVKLIALVTLGAFVVFALFYVVVYAITSSEYYKIVSGEEK